MGLGGVLLREMKLTMNLLIRTYHCHRMQRWLQGRKSADSFLERVFSLWWAFILVRHVSQFSSSLGLGVDGRDFYVSCCASYTVLLCTWNSIHMIWVIWFRVTFSYSQHEVNMVNMIIKHLSKQRKGDISSLSTNWSRISVMWPEEVNGLSWLSNVIALDEKNAAYAT